MNTIKERSKRRTEVSETGRCTTCGVALAEHTAAKDVCDEIRKRLDWAHTEYLYFKDLGKSAAEIAEIANTRVRTWDRKLPTLYGSVATDWTKHACRLAALMSWITLRDIATGMADNKKRKQA